MKISIQDEPQKVFVLSTPIHLLAKLRWEVARFQSSITRKSLYQNLHPAYHAFNCAVTAWHMTDWIWEYIGPDAQVEIAAKYKFQGIALRAFQDAMAKSSRAVNACQEIANGSKHREVRRKTADPNVKVGREWRELRSEPRKKSEGARRFGTVWVISDENGSRTALEVFKEAVDYWRRFLAPWMEDSFITGRPIRRTKA
jgi:hypothetical protein